MRRLPVVLVIVLALACVAAAAAWSPWWWIGVAIFGALTLLGFWDLAQSQHSILRNYPIMGHFRFFLEGIRPEMQQYFIELDTEGRPYDRTRRSLIYERAKALHAEQPFGTELDVYEPGYEFFSHSMHPKPQQEEQFRVRIGGSDCSQPYDMSLLNVSAMSFGALSSHAIRALNKGAALGDFAHDTGEGGLTKYHLENGGGHLLLHFGIFGSLGQEQFKDLSATE